MDEFQHIKDRIGALEKTLLQHNDLYYAGETTEDSRIISDLQYDQLYRELADLYQRYPQFKYVDSILNKVGGVRNSVLSKVKHSFPMLSLSTKTGQTINECVDFYNFVINIAKSIHFDQDVIRFTGELKYDGVSLRLKYVDGFLTQAITRGDGSIGEDVTINAFQIENIPKIINKSTDHGFAEGVVWVCGECIIDNATFENINDQQIKNNKPIFSNARNLAAGTMRCGEPDLVKSRGIKFLIYDVVCEDKSKLSSSHVHNLLTLEKVGFSFGDFCLVSNADGLYSFYKDVEKRRKQLPYEIDGVVYKVNNLELRDHLGYTSREPRWAIAHKYIPQTATTTITAIDIQVGRTGKITPVARLKPVSVGGVVVSNATLNNQSYIRKKSICVGDEVIIQRSGDVIPEVIESITAAACSDSDSGRFWRMPRWCPLCSCEIVLSSDEKQAKCTGDIQCPGQIQRKLLHFCNRRAMNVVGIAEKIIEELLDKQIISNPAELMALTVSDFLKLRNVKERSAKKMTEAIDSARNTTASNFLFALGIPRVGEEISRYVISNIKDLDDLLSPEKLPHTCKLLHSVKGVGPIAANNLQSYFSDKRNIEMVTRLLTLVNIQQQPISSQKLSGMLFAITGTFTNATRDNIGDLIIKNGGKLTNSISDKVTYLIAGVGGGIKRQHALEFKIPVITEEQFFKLLENTK